MDERRIATRTKQTPDERRRHHATREDRRRKAYGVLMERISHGRRHVGNGQWCLFNVEAAKRDAANLAAKLNIQV